MRTFLAFPVTGGMTEKLKEVLGVLQKTHADVKWVEPTNIHLTLKFLGEIDERQLEAVISMPVKELCRGLKPVVAHLCAVGAFPNMRRPRIVWAALHDPKNKFGAMAKAMEQYLAKLNFERSDRDFKPHITLGRVRSFAHLKELAQVMQQVTFADKIEGNFDKIFLYKSTLTPHGPIYAVLKEFEI